MALWALVISLIALGLSIARWLFDWWTGNLSVRHRGGRHEHVLLRVELLAGGTNCFVVRGGYSLIFLSLRVYNESEQRSATLSRVWADLHVGRRWRHLEPHPAEEAYIWGSLVRNSLPIEIAPSKSEDLYEVYQLPGLVSRTTARVRVHIADYTGAHASVEDTLPLRLDDRPPLDILYQTLDIR